MPNIVHLVCFSTPPQVCVGFFEVRHTDDRILRMFFPRSRSQTDSRIVSPRMPRITRITCLIEYLFFGAWGFPHSIRTGGGSFSFLNQNYQHISSAEEIVKKNKHLQTPQKPSHCSNRPTDRTSTGPGDWRPALHWLQEANWVVCWSGGPVNGGAVLDPFIWMVNGSRRFLYVCCFDGLVKI